MLLIKTDVSEYKMFAFDSRYQNKNNFQFAQPRKENFKFVGNVHAGVVAYAVRYK